MSSGNFHGCSVFMPDFVQGRRAVAINELEKRVPIALREMKQVSLMLNGRAVKAAAGSTLLEVCAANHIHVPTLCHHPMLRNVGTCRICLVEVQPRSDLPGKLVPSCVTPVSEGMVVETHSEAAEASVKQNLRFLRCRHPNACMTCDVNGRCEFQRLCNRFEATELLPQMHHERSHGVVDGSSHAVLRDMAKCVLCTRCVRACSDVQGMDILGIVSRGQDEHVATFADLPLSETACISCGQCTAVCPVGALVERPHMHAVERLLENKRDRIVVAHVAPAVRIAISEEFDMEPGTVSTGKLVTALRNLGFDYVFDTNFAADVTIVEEATEFVNRLTTGNGALPMFTSCCPAWINLVEKTYGAPLLPHLSTCRSPQAMMGSLIKSVFAKQANVSPDKIVTVGIMPCVAKKDEIERPQLQDANGKKETQYVLTTRELGRMMRDNQAKFGSLPDGDFDQPLGMSTGAAALFGATGGVMEAALRTAHFMVTGKELVDIPAVRPIDSLPGVRAVHGLQVGPHTMNVAVVTGTKNIRAVVDKVLAGDKTYSLIEVMACPGGCIGGGGEPKVGWSTDGATLMKRIAAVHGIDKSKKVRQSHLNPDVKALYDTLGVPPGQAHHLLHTNYEDRRHTVGGAADGPFGKKI